MVDYLLRRLADLDPLSQDETAALGRALNGERHVGRGEDIVRQDSQPTASTLLLDGFAARYKMLKGGSGRSPPFTFQATSSICTASCCPAWITPSWP
jgi:hypothetical protein